MTDHKANTPPVQRENTTDPQDNEIKGNIIGDLIGQPKPASKQADQHQGEKEEPGTRQVPVDDQE